MVISGEHEHYDEALNIVDSVKWEQTTEEM